MQRINQTMESGAATPFRTETTTRSQATYPNETASPPTPMSVPAEMILAVTDVIFRVHADHLQPQPSADYRKVMTGSWAKHLHGRGVPFGSVMELYERTVSGRNSNFMPAISEIMATWDKWLEEGFWANQNAEYDEPDYTLSALMSGDVTKLSETPIFVQTFAAFGECVECECDGDRWGKPAAQIFDGGELLSMGREFPNVALTYGESYWACKTGSCSFIVNAADLKPKAKAPEPPKEAVAEPKRKSWQIAADDCGLSEREMTPAQIDSFKSFMSWWRARANATLTPELFAEQWAIYAGEIEESKKVAGTQ